MKRIFFLFAAVFAASLLSQGTPLNPTIANPSDEDVQAILDRLGLGAFDLTAASKVNGFYYVDGTTFTTVQAAITAACNATPAGGTVLVPPGSYPQNSAFTLCSNVNIIGSGRGQSDNVTCPTTITSTQTSGDLFAVTNFTDIHVSDLCIKNTGAGGANAAIRLNYGQRTTWERLYIAGPWLNPIELDSSSTSTGSTIWNVFRDVHTTGTASSGTGCLLNSHDATTKVINNNYFFNVACTGGTSGFGIQTTSTTTTPVINENEFHAGEVTSTSGSAITLGANTVRDFLCQNCNIEGSSTGVSIGAGNTGHFDSSNISANGNNSLGVNIIDSSNGGVLFTSNNIGGVVSKFQVSPAGDVKANSFCLTPAACDPANINVPTGTGIEASGTTVASFNNTGINFSKQTSFTGVTFANLGTPGNGAIQYCSDCTIANPCAGGGTGAFAKRLNGVWVCN